MLKRMLMVIVMWSLLPVMAQAASWSLSTWARSAGGTVQVGSSTPRTYIQGQQIINYPTETPVTVTVTPNVGYVTSKVIYNGTTLNSPTQSAFIVNGPTAQSVQAYFSLQRFSITATVADNVGGTVNPAAITNFTLGQKLTAPSVITFTPATPTFSVSNILGIPVGAVQNPAAPAGGQAVTVTFPTGFIINSDIALIGVFSSMYPVAVTGNPQTALTGATVTLNGTGSFASGGVGISSYLWTQTSGPAVALTNADTPLASFIPTVADTYTFALTLQPGGSVSSTTVSVFESLSAFVRNQCYNCHLKAGVGVASNVFGNWSSSGHKIKGVVCTQCHVGVDTGGHPGTLRSGTVSKTTFDYTVSSASSGNFCITCHAPSIITDFAASKHSIRAGSASCSFCHQQGVHNPVAACTDCHTTDNTYGLTWPPVALTFHSNFTDSKVCTMCHTTHNPKTFTFKTSCP